MHRRLALLALVAPLLWAQTFTPADYGGLRLARRSGVGERAEVRIGPKMRRGPRTLGKRLPRFEEFIRVCLVPDSPVQSQGSICLPRLVWTHDLFLHDVLVCQQPQKTQLGNAAERQLFVLKIAEPMPCPEFRLDGPGAILAECRGICSRQL